MKGIIVRCLAELVKENFGDKKWQEILESSGFNKYSSFLATHDINDSDVMKMISSVCKVLNISLEQAADAFGDHWVNKFAPKIYSDYYKDVSSAKDFLLKMDSIHQEATVTMRNAHPPRFEYNWENEKTLVMVYNSERGLIDILVGLIKGVGKYFNENLQVTKLDNKKVRIVFES